jgi:PAS domain S-box-containing protein
MRARLLTPLMNVLRRRWSLPAVLSLAGGLLVTGLSYAVVQAVTERNLRDEFARDARAVASAVNTGISQHLDTLHFLRTVFDNHGDALSREMFTALCADARRRHPGIQALEWVPRVPAATRAAFEAAERQAGVADFAIHPEPSGDECFPVEYIEPLAENRPALGFDLASSAVRLEALERARDTGQPAATAPIHLVQDRCQQFGFLVYLPVYDCGAACDSAAARRAHLRGFVLAVFRASDFVRAAAIGVQRDSVDFRVSDRPGGDEAASATPCVYAEIRADQMLDVGAVTAGRLRDRQTKLARRDTLEVGGRQWALESRPSLAWLAREDTYTPLGVALGGVLMTVLCTGWVQTLVGRARRVDRLVQQRTSELSEVSRGLAQQVHDRQQAERALEQNLSRQMRINRLWQEELPHGQTLEDKLQRVADAVAQALEADFCRIWVTDEGDRCTRGCVHGGRACAQGDRCLHLRAGAGSCAELEEERYKRVPLGRFRVGRVGNGAETKFFTNDVRNDPRTQDLGWAWQLGIVALGEYRLQGTDGKPIGVLAVFAPHALSPEDDSLLDGIAASCSHVIQAGHAEAQLRHAHHELETRVQARTRELADANGALQAEIADRENAEEFLRRSEERFRQVAESAGEWIWEVDADGRFTFSSPIVEKILGYRPEELVGRCRLYDFLAPEGRDTFEATLRAACAASQPLAGLVNAYLHRSGARVMLETNGIPMGDAGGAAVGFCGTATDITARLRSEAESLVFSRQQSTVDDLLHIGLDDAPLADVLQGCLDKLLFDSCLEIAPRGAIYLAKEGEGTPLLTAQAGLADPALAAGACATAANCLADGGTLLGHAWFADGGATDAAPGENARVTGLAAHYCVPIRSGVETQGALLVYVNPGHERSEAEEDFLASVAGTLAAIIQRKRIEERLRESEARHRAITEAAQDAIITVDARGDISFWNPAAQRIFGYRAAEAVGRNLVGLLVAARDQAGMQQELAAPADAAAEAVRGRTLELCGVRADGREAPVQMSLSSYSDHAGRVTVALVHDITERKRAEAEIEEANRKLVDASHRAGMADVAAGVLHNVGNVLNSANVSAQLVVERVRGLQVANLARVAPLIQPAESGAAPADGAQRAQLAQYVARLAEHLADEQGTVLRELQSLTASIEHIKNIVGMQQAYAGAGGVIELFALDTVLDDALRMSSASFEQLGIRIVREQAAPVQLTMDRQKLLQVLVNLLRNAKHALEESDAADKCITVRVAQPDPERLQITVRDNGAGVAPEHQARLFAFGFTTKKDGHGFGLHSSALAVKEVGGTLTAHSDGRGCGAAFTIELPLAPARTSNASND